MTWHQLLTKQNGVKQLLPYFFLISSCLDFISALLKNQGLSFSTKIQCNFQSTTLHFFSREAAGWFWFPGMRQGGDEPAIGPHCTGTGRVTVFSGCPNILSFDSLFE